MFEFAYLRMKYSNEMAENVITKLIEAVDERMHQV